MKKVIYLMASIFVPLFLVGMICTAQSPIMPIHPSTLSECESGDHFDPNAGTCISNDNKVSDDGQVSDDNQTLLGYATSTAASTKFKVGDHIHSTHSINVRNNPGTDSGIITNLPEGSTGIVQDGPIYKGSLNWWTIQYDNGPRGWSSESLLELVPTMAKFRVGDHVQATDNINVRDNPGTDSGIITTMPKGCKGVVQDGPVRSGTRNYWTIQYDNNGPRGWSSENLLNLVNGDTETGSIIYLSDLKAYRSEFAETLYNSEAALSMGNTQYSKGVKLRAHGSQTKKAAYFNINGGYNRLKGHIGIDDKAESCIGKISVLIQGDGNELGKIDLMPGDLPVLVDINVKGVHQLKIEFTKVTGTYCGEAYYDLVA